MAEKIREHDGGILLGAVLGLSGVSALSKVFGFGEKVVIANYFGTTEKADVYFASIGVVLSVVFLVKELVAAGFMPVFSESLSKGGDISGQLFRRMFFCAMVTVGVVGCLIMIFAEAASKIFAPGFSGGKYEMMCEMMRMLCPAMVVWSGCMVSMSALNCRQLFMRAAWPEALMKLFVVVGLMVLLPRMGIYAVGWVIGIGVLGALVVELYFLDESRSLFAGGGDVSGEFGKVLRLMGPIGIGVVCSHISGMIDNMLGSMTGEGGLAYLGYSKKIIDAILLLGPVALVTVTYSQLCYLGGVGDFRKFAMIFEKSLRLIICFSMGLAVVLVILGGDIISIVFERGNFCSKSAVITGRTFMIYALGLVVFSVESLVVCSFFAMKDTRRPVVAGIAGVVIDVVLAWGLLGFLGHYSIAMAFVVSKAVKVIYLMWVIVRELRAINVGGIFRFCFKVSIVSGVAGAVAYTLVWGDFFSGRILKVIAVSGVFASTFLAGCELLRIREVREVAGIVFRKIRKTQV